MFIREPELFSVAAPDAELVDLIVAQQIKASSHDAGMAQFSAEVVVTQVCVCIEMDDLKIRELSENSFHRTVCNKVLAADHDGQLAVI